MIYITFEREILKFQIPPLKAHQAHSRAAASVESKMATMQEKIFCVREFSKTESATAVQRVSSPFQHSTSNEKDLIFQQDGAPPHWHRDVRRFLNESLLRRIGLVRKEDLALQFWPLRSPDLTPCDFFLWGFVKKQSMYHVYQQLWMT
jgi:hypothetical protein